MQLEKPIIWVRSSLDDLKALPETPRRKIGFALSEVQVGGYPDSAKPLRGLGGVYEIRADYNRDTYRAVYAVNLGTKIYVLHVFQKKSNKGVATPKPEMDLIHDRLQQAQELAKELDD